MFINFTTPKNARRDTHTTRKPFSPTVISKKTLSTEIVFKFDEMKNKQGTGQVGAPLKVQIFFTYANVHFC